MNLIPAAYYTTIYYQFLLLMTLVVLAQGGTKLESSQNLSVKKVLGFSIFLIILFYMGLRPLNFRFGDMVIYDRQFQVYFAGAPLKIEKDPLFGYFMFGIAQIASSSVFFFLCAFLYLVPLYLACKKFFKEFWFYGFFMLVISFSFWSYGTNGLRNGIASSLFLYGLSKDKKFVILTLLITSVFVHKSMFLPLGAYIGTLIYNNTKTYFYFWLACIPLSLALGGFFTNFFLTIGIVEEKAMAGYLSEFNQASEGVELKVGFRWDFILYSAIGVFAGWYYVFKQKYQDKLYLQLLNVFLFCNAFWVLVIRANYSNRLAYLSWFMLGVVIIYPLVKHKFFENQHQVIVRIILAYFAFTYIMNVFIYKL
jgi:EpsG family